MDNYQPSEAAGRADEDNARGLRYFCATGGERRKNVIQARDLFRLASERVPDNFWYLLNLAYTCAELEEWTDAARAVEMALERGPEWLRSSIVYERLADYRLKQAEAMQIEGDRCLKEGQPSKALEQFTQALRLALESLADDKKRQADLYSRVGYVYFDLGDLANARAPFAKAIQLYRENDTPDPGGALGAVCQTLLRDTAHYWGLDDEWQAWVHAPETNTRLQSDLAAARKALANYLDEMYQLSTQSGESSPMFPVVTPIAVEIGQGLIPKGPDTDWAFFKTYIPEMRTRIQDEMGIHTPGVRIRGNEGDLPTDSYIIMLDEVPLVMGNVEMNMRYCLASPETLQGLGIPKQALVEGPHPLTGELGCWIERDHWGLVTSNDLELWAEPLVYMIYHLEAVLRRNLADFLGIQEVENLLERWGASEKGASLIKAALPDQILRLRFARVLRALVKENVPISLWEDILEAAQGVGLASDDISAVVRVVRLRLKKLLPGNNQTATRLQLPPKLEAKITPWLWHEGAKTFFAIPPEETQELLSAIRELAEPTKRNLVLVTHSAELRPFVRRLVELEFPDLMVISQEELLSQEELSEAAQMRDEKQAEGADIDA